MNKTNVSVTSAKSGYRPDIDGLRAIAVLSVVLYHAGFKTLRGGFVGVDVFLVISGYLITKLLEAEVQKTGRVHYGLFYFRRLRRIVPALSATLALSALAAVIVLTPARLAMFGGSLLHAVVSASNIFFFFESGYFDIASTLKPLLHTWSLGVEEQFYLLWPAVVAWIAVRRHSLRWYALLALVSLAWAEFELGRHPSAVFFLMPFRVFEFALGAMLVSIEKRPLRNRWALDVCFSLGLILILGTVISYTTRSRFPGAAALLPCLGAALCIYSGQKSRVGALLRSRPAVVVGAISYSLYLVHWPILVFYKYVNLTAVLRPQESVALVAVSSITAYLMYRWVETPTRHVAPQSVRFWIGLSLSTLALTYVGALLWASGGWPSRPWMHRGPGAMHADTITRGRAMRMEPMEALGPQDPKVPLDPKLVNALVIGDSHGPDALNALQRLYPQHHFSISALGGCPPHLNIDALVTPQHPTLDVCREANRVRHDPEYLRQFDYLVINVLFDWYTPEHLREYLKYLHSIGVRRVIVFGGYMTLREEFPELVQRVGSDPAKLQPFVRQVPNDRDADLRRYVEELGYLFISKRDAFCTAGGCAFFDRNGIPFSYDEHHLSFEFGAEMAVKDSARVNAYLADVLDEKH